MFTIPLSHDNFLGHYFLSHHILQYQQWVLQPIATQLLEQLVFLATRKRGGLLLIHYQVVQLLTSFWILIWNNMMMI